MRNVRQLLEAKAPEIFAIGPDAPVIAAIRLMADKRIGAVLVMEGGRLAGILSERDYARKIVLQGRSSSDTAVREIMTAARIGGARSHRALRALRSLLRGLLARRLLCDLSRRNAWHARRAHQSGH